MKVTDSMGTKALKTTESEIPKIVPITPKTVAQPAIDLMLAACTVPTPRTIPRRVLEQKILQDGGRSRTSRKQRRRRKMAKASRRANRTKK